MKIVTSEEMKKIDQYAIGKIGIDGRILMENAGRVAAKNIMKRFHNQTFCVLIGSGNNGGDGFVIAKVLKENRHEVDVCVIPDLPKINGDADYHKNIYLNSGFTFTQYDSEIMKKADIVIDTMLGTGVKGEIKSPYAEIFQELNNMDNIVVSIDLPSGMPADESPVPENTLKADYTLTIGLPKLSYYTYPARNYFGKTKVIHIGIPNKAVEMAVKSGIRVWTENDVVGNWPQRDENSHKGSHGKVGIIAGSSNMPGAAVLTTTAAVKSGAGLTVLNTHSDIFSTITGHVPEATLFDRTNDLDDFINDKDIIAVGPGLGVDANTRRTVEYLIDQFEAPLVIDADGLSELKRLKDKIKKRKHPVIITPHPGEMARLIDASAGVVNKNRFDISREISVEYGIYVVLKGPHTLVATPDGEIFINDNGNAGLAKGGSGDVLTGMIAAFLGRYENIQHAVSSAVFMHGYTADYLLYHGAGVETITASQITDHLDKTFNIIKD
ncbi:bifunctional ADP-dependent NAD(P)H-hydrate dehydratase/NAD(P)H-hydrate epimerase [Salinicoccus sp. YB14-2]|uniref:bifunctional ADP-dependent NAD(P)H-hydrate dehydratase/NAD(P)H-hydrate epimerase n=1 Tax=Salinicoccus sp. YB14-2 TaxID=1572701 RepID=UPI0006901970|nr:bifunctional ADP-dependent NAD(P)H-hydrate dehydratase/NAD(P)H-hydrate epimerase [Salinicoccus sp. YB14-2]